MKVMLTLAMALATLTQVTNAVYFYAQTNKWRCFSDTVVKNNTLEMEVQVLDPIVLQNIIEANDALIAQGRTPNQGVRLELTNADGKQLFYGDVHPNVQYEYEAEDAGQYKLCAQLTELAFSNQNQKVKTKVKFSAEFHRNRRVRQDAERSIFDGETSMVDGTTESGNFHVRAKQDNYEAAATTGSFDVLNKRINKINTAMTTIIDYQKYEREQENLYRQYQERLASSLFNMTMLEIFLVFASAGFAVWNLRKFFVKKHIA